MIRISFFNFFAIFYISGPSSGLTFGLRAVRALKIWVRASGFRARAKPGAIPNLESLAHWPNTPSCSGKFCIPKLLEE